MTFNFSKNVLISAIVLVIATSCNGKTEITPFTADTETENSNTSSDAEPDSKTNDTSDAENCVALENRIHNTRVTLPANSAAKPNDEYTPAIITPFIDNTSILAWSDRSSNAIELIKLNESDQFESEFATVSGIEVHDMIENNGNLAMAVVANDPDIYSPKYCQGDSTPNNAVCGKMDMVMLNNLGTQSSRTTLTKKANADSAGAQFIWWYGHTARLASDGNTVGVYYRSALSAERPSDANEVDIHAGDTLKFVDANTGLLTNGGWDWGCSHSWSVRFAHNGYNWAAACHGDAYPNSLRMARMNVRTAPEYSTWLDSTTPTERALGGLVPIEDSFWLNYIQMENNTLTMKLGKFDDAATSLSAVRTIDIATDLKADYPFRAYMAAYGTDKLLLGWKSNEKLVVATADKTTGNIIAGPVITNLSIDNFQDIKTANNGDVFWAYSDGRNMNVNRIVTCQ